MVKTIESIDRYRLWLVVLSLIATGWILWLLHFYGIGTTPDSAIYLGTARHLINGRGFIQHDGAPLTTWAPFYPVFLAIAQVITGIDVLAVSPIANAILFGVTVFLSGLIALKHLQTELLAILTTIGVIVSPVLLPNSIAALSESLFIVLLLGYLVAFETYRENSRQVWLVLAASAVALACLTRYVGILLIPVGVLNLFLFSKDHWKSRIGSIIEFVLISFVPVGLWCVRNYIITGYPLGGRGVPTYTFTQSIYFIFNTTLTWYIPGGWGTSYVLPLLIAIGIFVILGVVIHNPRRKLRQYWLVNGDLLLLTIGYLAAVLYASMETTIDPPNDRLLSPIFVPITILVLGLLEIVVSSWERRISPRVIIVVLGIAVGIWLVYPINSSRALVKLYFDARGWGMTTAWWRNRETVNYLVANPSVVSDCAVYSNATDVLYLNANVETKILPDKSWNEYIKSHGTIFNAPPGNKICIVWLKDMEKYRPYIVPLETFSTLRTFETRAQFQDGGIYTIVKQ